MLIETGHIHYGLDSWSPPNSEGEEPPKVPTLEQHFKVYPPETTHFFTDPTPVNGGSQNLNQLKACNEINLQLTTGATLIFVGGPMGVGKSVLTAKVGRLYQQRAQVLQHKFGAQRSQSHEIAVKDWSGGLHSTGVPAQEFDSFNALIQLVRSQPGQIVLADEIQFAQDLEPHGLLEWKQWLAKHQMQAVLLGLNSTFAGQMWPNTEALVTVSDANIVMCAQCGQARCSEHAWRTMRMVVLENGTKRPASLRDPLVFVGGIQNGIRGDYYLPACEQHYQVLEN